MKMRLTLLTSILLLSGCLSSYQPYAGKVIELQGANVAFEPINPSSQMNYTLDGRSFSVINDATDYQEHTHAAIFNDSEISRDPITGVTLSNYAYEGAHATLPLPSYAAITNMNNGRRLIVKLVARSPMKADKTLSLSRFVADRLMLTENTLVQLDVITLANDGSADKQHKEFVESVRQSYPVPELPDITMPTLDADKK